MNARTLTKRFLATVGAGALVATLGFAGVAGAAPASASSGGGGRGVAPTVDNVKARCIGQIDLRLGTLDKLAGVVEGTPAASDGHRSALTGDLTGERDGLTSLRGQIDAASDLATLRDLCPKIVFDYRVYVLEAPKVHLTLAGDRLAAVDAKLDDAVPKLDDAIAKAKAAGKDVTAAEAAVADMKTKLGSVDDPAAIGDAVIPLTPAQFNDGSAMSVLTSSRDTAVADRGALAQAAHDAHTAVDALEALRGSGGSSATTTTTA